MHAFADICMNSGLANIDPQNPEMVSAGGKFPSGHSISKNLIEINSKLWIL